MSLLHDFMMAFGYTLALGGQWAGVSLCLPFRSHILKRKVLGVISWILFL